MPVCRCDDTETEASSRTSTDSALRCVSYSQLRTVGKLCARRKDKAPKSRGPSTLAPVHNGGA